MENAFGKSYTESLYYQIKLTAKYLKLLSEQLFEGLKIEATPDEFTTMDIINNNEGLCQRDLAKLLLKDRANTGRIVTTLEKRGYVRIVVDKKSNRLVKLLALTTKGKNFVEKTTQKIVPYINHINQNTDMDIEKHAEQISEMLISLRNKLSELVETQI